MTFYLVAHRCRGECTYSIAERIECDCGGDPTCDFCDGLGYWWQSPLGGWRLYPYWTREIAEPVPEGDGEDCFPQIETLTAKKSTADLDLVSLGLAPPREPIRRRI